MSPSAPTGTVAYQPGRTVDTLPLAPLRSEFARAPR